MDDARLCLRTIAKVIPSKMQVIILADRLHAEKSFLTCIEELKWHYIIRLPHTTHLECRFVCEDCSTNGGKAKQESGIRNRESGIGKLNVGASRPPSRSCRIWPLHQRRDGNAHGASHGCNAQLQKAKQESGIGNQESGIRNQESGIRIRGIECRGFAPSRSCRMLLDQSLW